MGARQNRLPEYVELYDFVDSLLSFGVAAEFAPFCLFRQVFSSEVLFFLLSSSSMLTNFSLAEFF
jgi:hypothetical protein